MTDRYKDIPLLLVPNKSDASDSFKGNQERYLAIRRKYDFAGITDIKVDPDKGEVSYVGKLVKRADELREEKPVIVTPETIPTPKIPVNFAEKIDDVLRRRDIPKIKVPMIQTPKEPELPSTYIVDGPLYRLREAAVASIGSNYYSQYMEQFKVAEKLEELKRKAFGGLGSVQELIPEGGLGEYSYSWNFSFPGTEAETKITGYNSDYYGSDRSLNRRSFPVYEPTGRYFLSRQDWLIIIKMGLAPQVIEEGIKGRFFGDPQLYVKYCLHHSPTLLTQVMIKRGEDYWSESEIDKIPLNQGRKFFSQTRTSEWVRGDDPDDGYKEIVTATENPPITEQVHTAIDEFLLGSIMSDPVGEACKQAKLINEAKAEGKIIERSLNSHHLS